MFVIYYAIKVSPAWIEIRESSTKPSLRLLESHLQGRVIQFQQFVGGTTLGVIPASLYKPIVGKRAPVSKARLTRAHALELIEAFKRPTSGGGLSKKS